jgi:hypothetical protein
MMIKVEHEYFDAARIVNVNPNESPGSLAVYLEGRSSPRLLQVGGAKAIALLAYLDAHSEVVAAPK